MNAFTCESSILNGVVKQRNEKQDQNHYYVLWTKNNDEDGSTMDFMLMLMKTIVYFPHGGLCNS